MNDGSSTSRKTWTWTDAGFNGFFRRSIGSTQSAMYLDDLSTPASSRQLNFDDMQVSGHLGDKLQVGPIILDAKTGRLMIVDSQTNEVIRLGDVSNL